MSEKRRDKKGRILRNGECQRDNGLYQFDYVDIFGKAKCVYSWKLEETDPLPKGKRKCISLREKEKEILNNRAEQLGLNLSGYVKKVLFPKKRDYVESIQLIIAIQDVVSVMQEKSSYVDCLQEEVDELWDMVKKLL